MKEENKIIDEYGRETGFTVPDGYFDALYKKVSSELPPMEMSEPQVNRTFWQKVKPYVYLAAMFAGIWAMMNVFNRVSPVNGLSLDNPPENIAMAMTDSEINDMAVMSHSVSDFELEEEVGSEYKTMEEFEKAFGYELEPEYASISVDIEE